MTSQLEEISKMRNVYKMTFGFCAFGTRLRKRTKVLAGHVDSADACALDTMRCHGHKRCNFTDEKHKQLVGYDSSHQCSRTHTGKTFPTKLAGRLANLLLGPTLTARMKRTFFEFGMQRERCHALLCRVFSAQSPSRDIRAALLSSRRDPAKA